MYQLIQKFLFFFKAQTAHGLHSPLVFELYTKVINPNLWPFQKDQLIENLEKFILSKFELKEFKLLQINTLNELSILIPRKNLVIYISEPYQNIQYKNAIDTFASNPHFNFVIHFFKGSILISSEIAPKQIFYLKHMQ